MYCEKCKNMVSNDYNYCPECGSKLVNQSVFTEPDINPITENNRTLSLTLGIISLIGLSLFVFAPISLILSIIGLIFAIRANRFVKNTASIIINAISLCLSFLITSIMLLIVMVIFGFFGRLDYDFDYPKFNHGDPVIENNHGENF